MRKVLWIIPVVCLSVAIGAPAAHADTIYTPTFTCNLGCTAPTAPTAPDVAFPSPSLTVTFIGQTFDVTLSSVDLPSDQYFWYLQPDLEFISANNLYVWDVYLGINDNTGSDYYFSSTTQYVTTSYYNGADGPLAFTPSTVPEPGTLALMFTGMIGLLLVSRKRIAQGL
jgi:PEP-CTERM motif